MARHCHQWPPMPAEAVIIRTRSPCSDGGGRLPFLDRVPLGGAVNLPCGLVEKLAAPAVGQGQGTVSIVQWPKGSGSAKAGCLPTPVRPWTQVGQVFTGLRREPLLPEA
jgi:hypothetical protein